MQRPSLTLAGLTGYLTRCRQEETTRPVPVIGHAAPDTDAVVSSVIEAYRRYVTDGLTAVPVVCGTVPAETAWLLGDVAPLLLRDTDPAPARWLADSAVPVILTDHNDPTVSPERVIAVVDHHPLIGSFPPTADVTVERVGSSCTLVARRCSEDGILPDADVSRILLGGILADTEGLNPAKTRPADEAAARWLAARANADIPALARQLQDRLLSETDPAVLYRRDYRSFDGALGFAVMKIRDTTPLDLSRVRELLAQDRETHGFQACIAKISRYGQDGLHDETYCLCAPDDLLTAVRRVLLDAAGESAETPAPDTVFLPADARHLSRKGLVPLLRPLFV